MRGKALIFLMMLLCLSNLITGCTISDIDKNQNEPLFDDCNIKQVNPSNLDNGQNVIVGTAEKEEK